MQRHCFGHFKTGLKFKRDIDLEIVGINQKYRASFLQNSISGDQTESGFEEES